MIGENEDTLISDESQFRIDWHDRNRFLYETLRHVATALVKARAIRLRLSGVTNLPATGPVLLMANHQSNLDPAIIAGPFAVRCQFLPRSSCSEYPGLDMPYGVSEPSQSTGRLPTRGLSPDLGTAPGRVA